MEMIRFLLFSFWRRWRKRRIAASMAENGKTRYSECGKGDGESAALPTNLVVG